MVEQLIRNQQVSGSNPLVGSSKCLVNRGVFLFRRKALRALFYLLSTQRHGERVFRRHRGVYRAGRRLGAGDGDVEDQNGFRVTTLYRTLLDLATDNLARDAVADVLHRSKAVGLLPVQVQQLRAVYDLSERTRSYLAHALPKKHRMMQHR